MNFSKLFSGLFIAAILTVSSCEVENGSTELYFKGELDGVEFNSLEGSKYYSNLSGGYTITSKINDTASLYIEIPGLKPATYTLEKDSATTSVYLWVEKGDDFDIYSANFGGSVSEYTITIDSYESGPGILQGTFEAKVTDIVSALFDDGSYHLISNGKFSLDSSK